MVCNVNGGYGSNGGSFGNGGYDNYGGSNTKSGLWNQW